MTPWKSFTKENVNLIPAKTLGVFQLAKSGETIAYVGRADSDLREQLAKFLDKGYASFQYNELPWVKETFEMHCRLYHHAGGKAKLDNVDHPYPPEGSKPVRCTVSSLPPAMCEV